MKRFNRLIIEIILIFAAIALLTDLIIVSEGKKKHGREYRVEIERTANAIEKTMLNDDGTFIMTPSDAIASIDMSDKKYLTGISVFNPSDENNAPSFFTGNSDYSLRLIGGLLFRFDYTPVNTITDTLLFFCNLIFGISACLTVMIMLYLKIKLIKPFDSLSQVPIELAKGNLTFPVKEEKNKFFGKFIWGIDLLREHLEEQKRNDLMLEKDKKTLLLSLSHDIKTPLSAIKLSAKALSRELYKDPVKKKEIADGINSKADEIQDYINKIVDASRNDFINIDVESGEFYLSGVMNNLKQYYKDKFSLSRTAFEISDYSDCLLKGDADRCLEVLQNVIENAAKYGDGRSINIDFSREENCVLITITNTGCTLPENEAVHIFDSFWRGSNAKGKEGSGLGLYICRKLMNQMDGDIYAVVHDDLMSVTAVLRQA
ncbi:MAG: HAMP domain-containing histidine kinase [Lachnospiraceae bacterium]|nr:HAMP domain-containing histidine kinase [Lachnospiraceae bacterium]